MKYNNLTEFLLFRVRKFPGLYIGTNELSKLVNFITGYQMRDWMDSDEDFYFGENGFLSWHSQEFCTPESATWTSYFLDHSNNDDRKALLLYFDRLEQYYNWYTSQAK